MKEPALIAGAFSALVNLSVAFGLNLSADQITALNVALAAVIALFVRQKVTPITDDE